MRLGLHVSLAVVFAVLWIAILHIQETTAHRCRLLLIHARSDHRVRRICGREFAQLYWRIIGTRPITSGVAMGYGQGRQSPGPRVQGLRVPGKKIKIIFPLQ